MADAGRVIAGTAQGRAPRRARPRHAAARPTGSSRRCSRSWSRSSRAPWSPTCSRAAARAASRRCRAARRGPCSSSATPAPCRVIAENLRRAGLEASAPRRHAATRVAWLADPAGAAADGPVRPRARRPAVRGHGGAAPGARAAWAPHVARGRRRRRQALLAGRPAGRDRAASIRAGAAVRGDGAHLLPASGRRQARREGRGLSGLVRPDHQRPPRRHRARRARVRPRRRRRPRQPAQVARCWPPTSGSPSSATAIAADPALAGRVEVADLRRPDGRLLPRGRGRVPRPRPAGHRRLRGRAAARPQQPPARARRRHRVLHDLARAQLHQLEPGQGDRAVRRRRVRDGARRRRRRRCARRAAAAAGSAAVRACHNPGQRPAGTASAREAVRWTSSSSSSGSSR